MLQNATLSGNRRPDLLTSLMNMSLVLRLPRKMHLCRSSSNVPRLPSFLEMLQNPHLLLAFDKVHNPLRLPRETTSERPKVVRTPGAFNVLTSKGASRHNGIHFFNISTSKSGPDLVCFVRFDFECASRHNAVHFFDISTSKSAPNVRGFYAFHLQMCFAPQRRASFHLSSGQLLRTCRLSEPTFRPSGATNLWKNTVFRDFPTFSRTWIFFLLRLSLL